MGRADLAGAALWSWCQGSCSCVRRTRCSRRCCAGGMLSRQRGAEGRHDRAEGAAGPPVPGVHQRVPVELGPVARWCLPCPFRHVIGRL